jgi:ketosteroid isomerase-like protein
MKKSIFSLKKNILSPWLAVLLFSALAGWAGLNIRTASAMGRADRGGAPLNDPADVAAVMQIEKVIGDAMVAADIDKLSQFYADDWANFNTSGKVITKEKILQDFKSGKNKLVSYELGPIDVQVLGNLAVSHGTCSEKRFWDGKDVSGQVVWMDLLEKRSGKWVLVRSAGAFVK